MCLRLSHKLLLVLALLGLAGCGRQKEPALIQDQSAQAVIQQYQALAKNYEDLIKAHPGDAGVLLQVAGFYYDFRDFQRVKELLKGTTGPQAKILLAKAYAKLQEYDFAIELFDQIVAAHLKLEGDISIEKLDVSGLDPEFLLLYGEVLEAKNLYPKALKVYSQVKEPFTQRAAERISVIKSKVETGVPEEIAALNQEAESFIQESGDDAAVILSVNEEMRVAPDKTSLSDIHIVEKVLKERGKELAEVDIGYDSTYQRVELVYARTITADGKVIYAGTENIRDVSRYLNYPLYSNSRAFIVSMPAVDVGAIIEYKLRIYSSNLINEDDFSFIYRLREAHPIYKAGFKLTVPKQTPVNIKYYNTAYSQGIGLEPATSESAGEKIYTWHFDKIKPIIPEYNMPPAAEVNPAFQVSSFSSWDEVYRWWSSLYQDKLALGEEAKALVAKLIAAAASDAEKAKKIYEYVTKNVRYVAIEYGDSGFEPHHAQDVFLNRYGDCKDQAVLLVAMLREAKLSAYPVLIPTRSAYPISKDFAAVNFDHAIAAVSLDNSMVFMDPTSETTPLYNLPLGDQGRTVLVFFEDSYKITETANIRNNAVDYQMEIALTPEEDASITRTVKSSGFFASSYRYYLKYTHPAIIEEDIQQKMMQISSLAKLTTYEITHPDDFAFDPVLTYAFSAEKFLNPARGLRVVPALDQIGLDYNLIGKDQRTFPIDFDGIYSKSARVRLLLAGNLRVKYLPESRTIESPWFKLVVTYGEQADAVEFFEEFSTLKRFVTQDEYQEFKKQLKEAIYFLREEIILERLDEAAS